MKLDYDKYIVAFSGGKDSMACLLHLLDNGVSPDKVELWHHCIDGSGSTFMDWEVTTSYCQAIGDAFNIPVYTSWKEGGFRGELLRTDELTKPIKFEDENWVLQSVGGITGSKSTRRKFPQISPDLSVRWCSAYLKIDVCSAAIRNQDRFKGIRTLVVSGERAEESDKNFLTKKPEDRKGRGSYAVLEPDRADLRNGKKFTRYVDRWRPIRDWKEEQVWEIIAKHKIRVHPAYYLGWGRVSCKFCIFGNANQFRSAYEVSTKQGDELIAMEEDFGVTMQRNIDLRSLIAKGTPYDMPKDLIDLATSYEYKEPVFMEEWILPSGAYGESCGPT